MKFRLLDYNKMYMQARSIIDSTGAGVVTDGSKAIRLLQTATEDGEHLEAMACLASIYESGKFGVPADPLHAVELYRRCIEKGGGEEPLFKLAEIYRCGAQGVVKDVPKAMYWYTRASKEFSSLRSLTKMALILDEGDGGVDANPFPAQNIRHLHSSVKQAQEEAFSLIGKWYERWGDE